MIPEEESVRLFISIGRNRKVFPREILALINAKAQVSRDDVGAIRILDNYSFVQVRNTAADTIIEALNGQNFRGRTLTVNYARSRREEPSNEDLPEGTEGAAPEGVSAIPEGISAVPEEASALSDGTSEPEGGAVLPDGEGEPEADEGSPPGAPAEGEARGSPPEETD
jgi:hypothetical protein